MDKGFSFIELIVTLTIIGIVAIIAIPRFFGVSEDAYIAKLNVVANSFSSAANLVHSSWLINGGDSSVTHVASEDGQIIGVNRFGWPVNTSDSGGNNFGMTASDCADLFLSLLRNAPSISIAPEQSGEFIARRSNVTCVYNMSYDNKKGFTYSLTNGLVTIQ